MDEPGKPFDCIILGAGPAGLAAAIYMGRYLRRTLILNHPEPRTRWHRPSSHNVLGFPSGIHRSQLLDWGHAHVASYDSVRLEKVAARQVTSRDNEFHVADHQGTIYRSRGLIIATGIEHALPDIPGIMDYAGHSIWHCPECDGYKCLRKPIAVIGNDRGSAEMALGISVWSPEITLCLNGQPSRLDDEAAAKLHAAGIRIIPQKIRALRGNPAEGRLTALEFGDGNALPLYGAFVNPAPCLGDDVCSQLPLDVHQHGWIKVDHRMRTNIPRCYAAGDVVAYAQTQLSVAMGTGATAAIWLHKELLPPNLCLSGRAW